MEITVNGAPRRFENSPRVADLVEQLGMSGKKIAVERNGEIVPKSAHAFTSLSDGDKVEIVVAVGGG
jgi:sulfur carrier protein